MCYKITTPQKEQLETYLQQDDEGQGKLFTVEDYPHFYHADGFTNPHLPITTNEQPHLVQLGVWKLIPGWVKTADDAKKYANTLNAVSEEIFDKASFRNYIGKNRCLLWVQGFFEPHHPDAKTTVPFYIHSKDGNPFSLGCVYSNWVNQDTGELMKTFSVITTPANELLSKIHNDKKRMPLIIAAASRQKWLSALSKEDIQGMMQPFPDGMLAGYPVSGLVYKKGVNSNVPEVIEPIKKPA